MLQECSQVDETRKYLERDERPERIVNFLSLPSGTVYSVRGAGIRRMAEDKQ